MNSKPCPEFLFFFKDKPHQKHHPTSHKSHLCSRSLQDTSSSPLLLHPRRSLLSPRPGLPPVPGAATPSWEGMTSQCPCVIICAVWLSASALLCVCWSKRATGRSRRQNTRLKIILGQPEHSTAWRRCRSSARAVLLR